jgi:general secretion pathway protein F
MPVFSYQATTMSGEMMEGSVEAMDERAVADRLKNSGLIPLKITAPKASGLRRSITLRSSTADLLVFTGELSVLLAAGLPLDRSLQTLEEISESREMKRIIASILESIREGGSFSEALQKHPRTFPKLYVNMVRAGEAGGILDVVLDKLNEFLESTKELKDHVVSAMIYPAILMLTGGASIVVLLVFVLPRFAGMFSQLGSSMPLPAHVLLGVSEALRSYWWCIATGAVFAWVAFKIFVGTDAGRYRWDAFKFLLMGDVLRKLETERFCRTLGALLQSGVPFLQALGNSKEVVGNRVMASRLDSAVKGAREGKGISRPLAETGAFPRLALSMIRVGEETGQLDTMLIKVADVYEKSLKEAVKRFVGFVEPAMILGMGLVIGAIVVSMLMAVFSVTDLPF